MPFHALAERIGRIEALDRATRPLVDGVGRLIRQGGLKDLLSGTWLGHPLHPMLTDIPIGSFTSASLLDLIGGRRGEQAADALVAVGLVSALPTAAAGASDWSDTYGPDQRTGLVHAAANVAGLALYGLSLLARRRGDRGTGKVLGLAGMTTMTAGGYLGGYLSFSRGVGVNHAFLEHPPEEWTAVADEGEVLEGKPVRVEAGEAGGAGVLLYRTAGAILAIGSRCSHAGGPLEDGDVDTRDCTVQCPWHQSVFRLSDGAVVHGPASVPQVAYDVRVGDGKVEIRRR